MKVSRREFVRGGIATGAAVASGLIVIGCGNDVQPAPLVKLPVGDDGRIEVLTARYPDLTPVGGALTLQLTNPAAGDPEAVLLVHRGAPGDDPEYVAMNSSCPHASCPLGYSQKDQLVECPCHGSRFHPVPVLNEGGSCEIQVQHAPAFQGPKPFLIEISGGSVFVNVRASACGKPPPKLVGGKLILPFTDFPALATPGGSVIFDRVEGYPNPIIVIRKDSTTVAALDAMCTHTGCTVEYASKNMDLECPCHGSTFDLNGNVTMGPALTNVKKFTAVLDATDVTVTIV
jgi:cytochrome b6-f complex iron-sulfur subunit